jgi:hypothetical protein
VLEDSNLMDNPLEWKHFKFEVYPGLKEISFVYQKFNSEQNADMHLDIKVRFFEFIM